MTRGREDAVEAAQRARKLEGRRAAGGRVRRVATYQSTGRQRGRSLDCGDSADHQIAGATLTKDMNQR